VNLRHGLAEARPLLNAWITLGSPHAVELAGEAGWHAVTIDQQHGIGGHAELLACLTAAKAAGMPALVRVAALDFGLIGRALDAGAQGVICPMVETPEDARRLVEAVKYPPLGMRSWGPFRARLLTDPDMAAANAWTIACAQIETGKALGHLDAILAVPGLDMVYAGPNDLAISLSGGASRDIRSPAVIEALDEILAACRRHRIIAGVFANDADYARPLIDEGWDVISCGTDAGWLAAEAARTLAACAPVHPGERGGGGVRSAALTKKGPQTRAF
jgi:4-hydroxy-2-oxoheptanedioate aldolase